MNEQQDQEANETITLKLWTYADAVKAVPYLRSVVGSLREHWLESAGSRLRLRRIDTRRGRPDRQALLLRAGITRDAELAEGRVEETLNELMALDVYPLDPTKGLALIPFRHGDELAWYVFDLFAPEGIVAWRFHEDTLETRRSLADQQAPEPVDRVFASRPFWGQPSEQHLNSE